MVNELLELASKNLNGISKDIPELTDLDSHQVSSITSTTVVNTILQLAKKGNVGSLKEMLSGNDTLNGNEEVKGLQTSVSSQLQSKLNISGQSAQQLAVMALPIIMNMLNSKVKTSQNEGFDINSALNTISAKKGGLINSVLGMLGGNNQNSKMINSILQQLIKK